MSVDELREIGLSVARLSKLTGIGYQTLYRSFHGDATLKPEKAEQVSRIVDTYKEAAIKVRNIGRF